MICQHCAAGADLTTDPSPLPGATRALAVAEHTRCPGGTWCDCQHGTAAEPVIAARRAAMPRGGLARITGLGTVAGVRA